MTRSSKAADEDASKKMKVADGLWYNAERAPRKFALFLVRDSASGMQHTAVIFGIGKEISQPEGLWTIRMQNDASDKAHMVLGFHHTNTVCDNIKMKHLYLAGRNIWRDVSNYEALILFGISGGYGADVEHVPSIDLFNLMKTAFLRTQEECLGSLQIPSDLLAQVEFVLGWNETGCPVQYVLLLKDMQVIFQSVSGRRTEPHGMWAYFVVKGTSYLATHFHFEGKLNETGRPLADRTILKSIAPADVETPTFGQEVYFAVGTEKERTAVMGTQFWPVDDTHSYAVRYWHILAQVVYRNPE